MTTEPDTLPIDAWCIALDETANYYIKPEHRPLVRKILGVYLFDRNVQTHCGELTPSYYLIHLYDQVIAEDDATESQREELYASYEAEQAQDRYMHCARVERIMSAHPERVHHYGDTGVSFDDTSREDQMESLREHFVGNWPL